MKADTSGWTIWGSVSANLLSSRPEVLGLHKRLLLLLSPVAPACPREELKSASGYSAFLLPPAGEVEKRTTGFHGQAILPFLEMAGRLWGAGMHAGVNLFHVETAVKSSSAPN
jgi:hypothetical protein